jgi:hypothetical protein
MKLIQPVSGLLILSALLLFTISCKKKFDTESDTDGETLNKGARIASVANYLTDQPALNFFELMSYYCGFYGRAGAADPTAKQKGQTILSEAAANGFKVIRFFAAGTYSEMDPANNAFPVVLLWKNNPTAFFQAFDNLVADAGSLGIQLVPSLVTGISDFAEVQNAEANDNKEISLLSKIALMENITINTGAGGVQTIDCINNPTACKNRSEMRQFALDIVNRYKNSTSILYWEIGNELQLNENDDVLTASQIKNYVLSMAADIKAIDNFHMLDAGITNIASDKGMEGNTYNFYLANTPNIDIASIHPYEPYITPSSFYIEQAPAEVLKFYKDIADANGKTLVIAETGAHQCKGWSANNFSDYVMSLMLAKTYLKIPLAMAWTWESKINGYYVSTGGEPNGCFTGTEIHPEMKTFSIDPGEDDDAISILHLPAYYMGNNNNQTAFPITGDFNGDGYDDFGVKTVRGLFQVSLLNNNYEPQIPSQWLSQFGDENLDPGGSPFKPVTGDWNGDGKTDIGLKSKDGRWFAALRDPIYDKFIGQAQWLSNFGNEYTDPGGAPFVPITGDWNGDGKTDIGLKSKDGRWFVAFSNGSGQFVNQAQWLSNFGNDNADPGGAPFEPITGDWNGDGKTDIGLKSKDGRWFTAVSDGSGQFINQAQWLSNFGNDNADPGGAPFLPITGDWNGDGKTDIGLKSNDGRWFVSFSSGNQFINQAQWLTGFGNNYTDPAANPCVPFTGDWNNDGKTDIGIKSNDGRWFISRSDGSSFILQKQCFQ